MKALIFDKVKTKWETSKGFEKVDISKPVLDEKKNKDDANYVIMKVHYAGICGTDRGIWNRQAFRDAILNSIDEENTSPNPSFARRGKSQIPPLTKGRLGGVKTYRIIGHEFFGEIVEKGSKVKGFKIGGFVSPESHVVCNNCYQCKRGEKHVCTREKILGISHDGGFAEYAKIPSHILWKTDTSKIRPEIAAMQEPFGNAVHAASKVDVKGKTIAIFGLGPIGMFLTLIVREMGAKSVIGVEPNPVSIDMANKLGIDYVVPLKKTVHSTQNSVKSYQHNSEVTEEIMKITKGMGVDVSFEMSGFNSSVNNCLYSTRRGGDIILFGIKQGDFVFEDYNRLIVRGFTMHAVIGRQVWDTWKITKKLFEDPKNKIQEKMYNVILNQGKGTILSINDYTKPKFEKMMREHPKLLIQF